MKRKRSEKNQGPESRVETGSRVDFYKFLAGFFLLVVTGNIFLFQYLRQEETIYSWDYSAYEAMFVEAVQDLSQGFPHFAKAVLDSIAFTDHSLLAPALIAPIGYLLGPDRAVFLFSELNLFAFPALLLLGLVFLRLLGPASNRLWSLLPMGLCLLTPYFWAPLVRGYIDIVTWGVVLALWLLALSAGKERSLLKAAGVGILLVILVFLRRWLGFWSVCFFVAGFLQWLYSRYRGSRPFWKLRLYLAAGLTALVFFAWLAKPLMSHILFDNYLDEFAGYKMGHTPLGNFLSAAADHGWLVCALAGLGFYWASKAGEGSPFLQVVAIQILLSLFLLGRVHPIHYHQQYPFTLVLILFQSFFLFYLWRRTAKTYQKVVWTLLFLAVTLVNFCQGLVPGFALGYPTGHWLVETKEGPLHRNDLGEIARLIHYLGSFRPEPTSIYVLAGSMDLNFSTLQNAACYLRLRDGGVCSRITSTFDIDLRDGFPWPLFRADYLVVAEPIQYTLWPQDQLIVGVPAEQVLRGEGIGKAFQRLPEEFHLDGGIQVGVYRRVGKIHFEDVQAMNRSFQEAHAKCEKFSDASFQRMLLP